MGREGPTVPKCCKFSALQSIQKINIAMFLIFSEFLSVSTNFKENL